LIIPSDSSRSRLARAARSPQHRHPWQGERRFLDRVFKLEAFKKAYLAKLDEFSRTIFPPERLVKQVMNRAGNQTAIEEGIGGKTRPVRQGGCRRIHQANHFPGATAGETDQDFCESAGGSVVDQLAGKSDGQTLDDGPRPGGRGGPGGPGAPAGFGPGGFLGRIFVTDFDADKNAGLDP
jgi:hypothetical protein